MTSLEDICGASLSEAQLSLLYIIGFEQYMYTGL